MDVKPEGICWVITIPGILAGNCRTTSRIASVPPVEAPMAIKSMPEFIKGVRAKPAGEAPDVEVATDAADMCERDAAETTEEAVADEETVLLCPTEP